MKREAREIRALMRGKVIHFPLVWVKRALTLISSLRGKEPGDGCGPGPRGVQYRWDGARRGDIPDSARAGHTFSFFRS